ncbi:MAG: hypothetical protein KJ950_04050 [Proteobacteria bacterium]|nr:hypothetical protein [Pseudomonadota bacterium]MBU1688379.1 hypothetical protein [Pseudomonadota bacterium]
MKKILMIVLIGVIGMSSLALALEGDGLRQITVVSRSRLVVADNGGGLSRVSARGQEEYSFRTGMFFQERKESDSSWFGFRSVFRDPEAEVAGNILPGEVKDLARQLIHHGGVWMKEDAVVAVATFVNLNHLYTTSALGRFLAEQLIAELQQGGVKVVEIRKSPAMLIRYGSGEYGLSRDMDELSYVQQAGVTVVGTYLESNDRVYLNARIIRNQDNMVVSTAALDLAMDEEVRMLLADEKNSARVMAQEAVAVPIFPFRGNGLATLP